MYWVIHNSVTIEVTNSQQAAHELAKEISARHESVPAAVVRFLPFVI
ncbi:MAG: hypothetical protein ACD_86C00003G0011 [uncultured bacterium]|nr:MAG: hypothetical protein ACD_86C00003G0011 [uncultured bacterium]